MIIEDTLKQFDKDLEKILLSKYKDILIYGSVSINSFTPNQGDIDFIVVLNSDLDGSDVGKIFNLHDRYRSKEYFNLEYQLEGVYYPEIVLKKTDSSFIGCYIGTGRKGWRQINSFQNNCFDLIQIKQKGISYKNKKYDIYEPSNDEVNQYILGEIDSNKKMVNKGVIPSFVVIQFVARTAFYLNNKRIGSKKEACIEFYRKYINNEFIRQCSEQGDFKEIERKFPEHKKIALQALHKLIEIM